MYPTALHKIPTQTDDTSQVFERRILNKQPNILNKICNSCDKNTTKDLEQVFPNMPTIFFLHCYCQRQVYIDYHYLHDQSSVLYAQFLNKETWKKLKLFERFNLVDTDKKLHFTKFTTLNDALSSYQKNFALGSAEWSVVLCLNG